ncbi:MAG: UDP-N-acetylmuramoyl-L-alanyl-D-glutamate--2,6-diaminopimelate ligase [Alphaproteobacteria bacterium]|nr:UDP-N-acetylmuramoyl-L-alanyl-D-glutamate--2,6-diaminopimelate ligase [Alphaproteobacteria bacterium]
MLITNANIPSLRLTQILPVNSTAVQDDLVIHNITCDSRKVGSGSLFFALRGTSFNGAEFIAKAIEAGASAIVCDEDVDVADSSTTVPILKTKNPRQWYSLAAKHFYQKTPDKLVAITGTNGKTSITHFCRQLWRTAGFDAASMGTVGIYHNDKPYHSKSGPSLTTPDPVDFYRTLRELADLGVTHAAFEASSHGLDQHRFCGEGIKAAGFTNLTRDHLDYHKTMDAYFQAKALLFSEYLDHGSIAVLNQASDTFTPLQSICQRRKHHVISYGTPASDIYIHHSSPSHQGFDLTLSVFGSVYETSLPLVGSFQIENVLCSLGLVLGLNDVDMSIIPSISKLISVPGRMQLVGSSSQLGGVFVDYAHTPDALEKALLALKPHTKGSIYVVFGCGGDRDPGKRPLMGETAKRLADHVIITDDNPRTENPQSIRQDILTAVPQAQNIADRKEAIRYAISCLKPGDTLLIAGKGHENYQIIGTTSYHFDDVEIASGLLSI